MGKIYKTKLYKKAQDNIKRKRKEAQEIIYKSKIIDTEVKFLYCVIIIVCCMFMILPFLIMKNIKKIKITSTQPEHTQSEHTQSEHTQPEQTQPTIAEENTLVNIF